MLRVQTKLYLKGTQEFSGVNRVDVYPSSVEETWLVGQSPVLCGFVTALVASIPQPAERMREVLGKKLSL